MNDENDITLSKEYGRALDLLRDARTRQLIRFGIDEQTAREHAEVERAFRSHVAATGCPYDALLADSNPEFVLHGRRYFIDLQQERQYCYGLPIFLENLRDGLTPSEAA